MFPCEIVDHDPSPLVNTDEVEIFGESELPGLSLSRVTRPQIRRFFEHHRDPTLPANFD